MPFFSVVIPTYNRAKFIASTVNSILDQEFQDFEIVLMDDGSTDDTKVMVERNFGNNHKVNYFYQENQERGVARNNGFRKATGEYVVFFDSDDVMHEAHLKTLYKGIQAHPGVNFIASKYDFIRNGKHIPNTAMSHITEGFYGIEQFLTGNFLACNFCVRRKNPNLYLFLPDRKYNIMEDWVFLVQNLAKDKIYIIDQVTISMIDHGERSMRGDNEVIINKREMATQFILDNVELTLIQRSTLEAHSFYFCGIHYYLDHNRRKGLRSVWKAIKMNGLQTKFLVLLLKLIAGRKLILSLKFK